MSRRGNNNSKDMEDKKYNPDKAKQNPKSRKSRRNGNGKCRDIYDEGTGLSSKGRDNNPNWYFTDKMLAEQVSQLSFQQIAGLPTKTISNKTLPIANIVRINVNPSPGCQFSETYAAGQRSAINQAGFKLYSMLSAYTGRSAVYGPQDLSIMILYMGEVISMVEYLRRVFGCMFMWSERDRSFPKQIIKAMGIDPDDLMRNYSDLRTKFNGIVQRLNQIPIPQNIAYFDKCASMYEKIYKDAPSAMGAFIFMAPYTTWKLDETVDQRGTRLTTKTWLYDKTGAATEYTTMGSFLIDLESMVEDLMGSSTFNVVYTDILNLATKMNVPFWKFDYLSEGYAVSPEYNENFLLQFHNMTTSRRNPGLTEDVEVGNINRTAYNDVQADAANNRVLYDPGFLVTSLGMPQRALCDMLTDVPTVETRIEALRFMSLAGYGWYNDGTNKWQVENALPDHYVVFYDLFTPSGEKSKFLGTYGANIFDTADTAKAFGKNVAFMSHIDWAPLIYNIEKWTTLEDGTELFANTDLSLVGDLNFWTWVDSQYIQKIIDFVGIALYSLR